MAKVTKPKSSLDDESRLMIYNGLNLSELGRLFHMDHRVLVEKLTKGGVEPSGKRGSANTYLVHEVAPHLVKPIYDIEQYMRTMNHAELPKMVTKEYWNGQLAKQTFLEREGDLWDTAAIVTAVGELLKLVKMNANLMVDAVERSTELSDRQKAIIRGLTDGMLGDVRQMIIDNFTGQTFDGRSSENQETDDEI